MKDGYKDSPLGKIPNDWKVGTINDFVISFKGGAALSPSDFVKEGGFPVIPKKAIGKGGKLEIDQSNPTFCSIPFSDKNENNIIDKDYIVTTLRDLVPSGPSIGYMVQFQSDKRFILAQGVYGFKVNNSINREFLTQYSNTLQFRKVMQTIKVGSTQVHIRNKDYFGVHIPLPLLPEQQKIAEILSTVDDKIEVIDQQIIVTQALKKGLMQRLLTKGIGHTEFKDSPLGEIPKSWEVVPINEIAEVKGGKRLPKGEALIENKTEHPYIRVTDMFMGGVSLEKILYVPDNIFPVISRYTISKDDLFISVAGTLGIVGEVPFELDGANLTENADKLTNIKINKSFLLQLLLSPFIQDLVQKEQTNNAQPKLALTRIKEFIIPKPPKEEQEKIASVLSTVDNKLEVLLEKKAHYQELKQGLRQQLLTGKIRVKV